MPEKIPEIAQFPSPDFHGDWKYYQSSLGFQVSWFQADQKTTMTAPGIYIILVAPNGDVKEKHFFRYGQEQPAEEKYQKIVRQMMAWDQKFPHR